MDFSIQSELQLFAKELYEHLTPSFLENLARELCFLQAESAEKCSKKCRGLQFSFLNI
ncbi:hypothetical protein M3215_22845 [Bacillus cytotoxicus]|uniref:Uncharacterized protein n=2 Tax=Bacillus cytotoxicus TaxID=580165 RepID=A0ACC6ACB8_9BACI|nr:hypothetical protein [Bacillus cytotoxicus]